jgi:hypothetical protein
MIGKIGKRKDEVSGPFRIKGRDLKASAAPRL